jgi:hypothetical protein
MFFSQHTNTFTAKNTLYLPSQNFQGRKYFVSTFSKFSGKKILCPRPCGIWICYFITKATSLSTLWHLTPASGHSFSQRSAAAFELEASMTMMAGRYDWMICGMRAVTFWVRITASVRRVC